MANKKISELTAATTPAETDVMPIVQAAATKKATVSAWVRGALLTGLSTATNAAIAATDSVLVAMGKAQAQITAILASLNSHIGNTTNAHGMTTPGAAIVQAATEADQRAALGLANHEKVAVDSEGGIATNGGKVAIGGFDKAFTQYFRNGVGSWNAGYDYLTGNYVVTSDGGGSLSTGKRLEIDKLSGAVTAYGPLVTTHGLVFPAAQIPSSSPNMLDDYEEGSCALVVGDQDGVVSVAGSTNAFRYIKIGRFIHVSGTLSWSGLSVLGAGKRIAIYGLPFPVTGNDGYYRAPAIVGSSAPGSMLVERNQITFGADFGGSFLWGTFVSQNNVDGNLTKAHLGESGLIYGLQLSYMTTE